MVDGSPRYGVDALLERMKDCDIIVNLILCSSLKYVVVYLELHTRILRPGNNCSFIYLVCLHVDWSEDVSQANVVSNRPYPQVTGEELLIH